eukprot:SAG31_NODE_112_length_24420_cov_19.787550_8_plen_62_part_00
MYHHGDMGYSGFTYRLVSAFEIQKVTVLTNAAESQLAHVAVVDLIKCNLEVVRHTLSLLGA